MKKKKSNKLRMFWQKMRKPLMILSFVGNILFLLFIIVGCVGEKKKAQQINAEDNRVLTLVNTQWTLNDSFITTPSGADFISSQEDITESYSVRYTIPNYDGVFVSLKFNTRRIITSSAVLSGNKLVEYGSQTNVIFASYDSYLQVWRWNDDVFKNIFFSDYQSPINDTQNTNLINWFYENATLLSDSPVRFEFLSQINYNGPYGQSIDSMFINANNTSSTTFEINLPMFVSNGNVYNQIKCWYLNGQSMSYKQDNGTIATNTNNQTWYFLEMEYVNTITQESTPVNYRKFEVGTNTTLVKGSTWKASSYRYLYINTSLTPEQRESLECFNNDYFSGVTDVTSDVGIGNAFTLLGSAFGGLTALWSIKILPGLSLGLFLFLPLIVIVIITIIKLVKR